VGLGHRSGSCSPLEERLGVFAEPQRESGIRRIGFSEVPVDQIRRGQVIAPIATVQNRYNLADHACEEVHVWDHDLGRLIGVLTHMFTRSPRAAEDPGDPFGQPGLTQAPAGGVLQFYVVVVGWPPEHHRSGQERTS
jgi:hypothetical protein